MNSSSFFNGTPQMPVVVQPNGFSTVGVPPNYFSGMVQPQVFVPTPIPGQQILMHPGMRSISQLPNLNRAPPSVQPSFLSHAPPLHVAPPPLTQTAPLPHMPNNGVLRHQIGQTSLIINSIIHNNNNNGSAMPPSMATFSSTSYDENFQNITSVDAGNVSRSASTFSTYGAPPAAIQQMQHSSSQQLPSQEPSLPLLNQMTQSFVQNQQHPAYFDRNIIQNNGVEQPSSFIGSNIALMEQVTTSVMTSNQPNFMNVAMTNYNAAEPPIKVLQQSHSTPIISAINVAKTNAEIIQPVYPYNMSLTTSNEQDLDSKKTLKKNQGKDNKNNQDSSFQNQMLGAINAKPFVPQNQTLNIINNKSNSPTNNLSPVNTTPDVNRTMQKHHGKRPESVICYFCKMNNCSEEDYTSHCTMSNDGKKVTCLKLQKIGCTICNAVGEKSHPEIYCQRREGYNNFITFAERFKDRVHVGGNKYSNNNYLNFYKQRSSCSRNSGNK